MRRWWQLPEGWLSLLLLLGMLVAVVRSIEQAAWPASLQVALSILTPAAVVGLAFGFLLAWFRRFPGWLAHIVGVAGGVAWVVQLSGILRAVQVPGASQPVAYLHPALQGWKDLATELLIRFIILWRAFVRGAPGEDVVIFVVLLALVAWMLGFLGAWFSFRSHWPWAAVGFMGFVILLNLFYGPQVPPAYFGIFVFLSMVFLIYYLWRQRESAWEDQRVRYPRDLSRGILWIAVALSAILVVGTSFLPTTASGTEGGGFWDRFFQPWREVRQTWERLFSNVGNEGTGEGRMREYSSAFELGGPRVAASGIALEIRTSRNDYLRGISFDQYNGHGWTNTAEHGPALPLPGDPGLHVPDRSRLQVTQVIVPRLQGGNMVFAIAEPISVSLPAMAELSEPAQEAGFADIVVVRSRSPLAEGQPYRAISLFSAADKASLRLAGQDYPDWLRRLYLQLPPTLPQRVRELADQIVGTELDLNRATLGQLPTYNRTVQVVQTTPTADGQEVTLLVGAPGASEQEVKVRYRGEQVVGVTPSGALVQSGLINPYDAVEAIQDYLRTQYSYRTDVPYPPAGIVDFVDYFLFENQVGYCDYFASAMAVLARTQGIPARLVRGYAAGSYDQEKGTYVVSAALAHSWVEVYFPAYGWERFEPTAADYTSLPNRPEEAPKKPEGTPGPALGPSRPKNDRERYLDEEEPMFGGEGLNAQAGAQLDQGIRVTALALGSLFLAVALAGSSLGLWIGRGLGRLSPVAATYERMCRWASLVRLTPPGQPTPYETAAFLATTLPNRRPHIEQIAALYVRERFSRHSPFPQEVGQVRRAWRSLRWPLWSHPLRHLRFLKRAAEPAEEVVE
jgi:transglutaminase-like putative cysteine protease